MITGIYKILSPSGKIYIGQTRNFEKRMSDYKGANCKKQIKLFASLNKYGRSAHDFTMLHELPEDVEQGVLNIYEQLYMDLYRDCGVELLNLREAGSNGKQSSETREKMSTAKMAQNLSLETREKRSDALKGIKRSLETREKIRVANLGRKGGGMLGKKHSPESIEKMRAALKGRKLSLEHREKMKGKTPWNKGLKLKAA